MEDEIGPRPSGWGSVIGSAIQRLGNLTAAGKSGGAGAYAQNSRSADEMLARGEAEQARYQQLASQFRQRQAAAQQREAELQAAAKQHAADQASIGARHKEDMDLRQKQFGLQVNADKRADMAANPDSTPSTRKHEISQADADQNLERQKKLAAYRASLKKGKSGVGGASTPEDISGLMQALGDQYGGEVPPAVAERVKQAAAIRDRNKRQATFDRILANAGTDTHKSATEDRLAAQADYREMDAYRKAMDPYLPLGSAIETQVQALKDAGVDLNSKEADIPGHGSVGSMEPDWMVKMRAAMGSDEAEKALRIRAADLGAVAMRLLEVSGRAATDSERKRLDQIAQITPGSPASTYLQAVRDLRRIYQDRVQFVNDTFKNASTKMQQNASEHGGQSIPNPEAPRDSSSVGQPPASPPGYKIPAGITRVKVNGKVMGFKGTPEEAQSAGLEVVQ